jgi:hypothetical protein
MKVLDLGCGDNPLRWFPGADLCDYNLEVTNVRGRRCYYDMEEIPSNQYQLVWYRYGERINGQPLEELVAELTRITKKKAWVVLVDYLESIGWETDTITLITMREWVSRLKKAFCKGGWKVDSEYKGWSMNSHEGLLVLTKGV